MNTTQQPEDRGVQSRARKQADGKLDLHLAGFAQCRPLPNGHGSERSCALRLEAS